MTAKVFMSQSTNKSVSKISSVKFSVGSFAVYILLCIQGDYIKQVQCSGYFKYVSGLGSREATVEDVTRLEDVTVFLPHFHGDQMCRVRLRRDVPKYNGSLNYSYVDDVIGNPPWDEPDWNHVEVIRINEWILELDTNENFKIAPGLTAEWVVEGDTKPITNTSRIHSKGKPIKNCQFKSGNIRSKHNTSSAWLTICEEKTITGLITVDSQLYTIAPLNRTRNSHILMKEHSKRIKRSATGTKDARAQVAKGWKRDPLEPGTTSHTSEELPDAATWEREEFFNLTGDTMDVGIARGSAIGQMDEGLDKAAMEDDPEEQLGYFYDTAWVVDVVRKRGRDKVNLPKLWLEIALAADYTVINFHGKNEVEEYILALMNIVSAIYKDPSLEANIQLVLVRLVLYPNKKQSVVRAKDAKRSLGNVNGWNKRLHASLAPGEARHDVAVWLTRADIGGPSGYAPVSGACDPDRSCALNRDEGLTSAFIIAHETAHILGLSHDGDKNSSNDCDEEGLNGSIMAPMVSATFHKFSWSECSKREFRRKATKWNCLKNRPDDQAGRTELTGKLKATYSMDEQCRLEFGEGYYLCRAFDVTEPCAHLWCGHFASPMVCKTKKGPPLEGTDCGYNKWCINGYCEVVDVRRLGLTPIVHNPQDGGWSNFSSWTSCSRSCNIGVQFRTRKCDNPRPSNGGRDCLGKEEEWQLCNNEACQEPLKDFRAQQCDRLKYLVNVVNTSKANMNWLPYESEEDEMKCQLVCASKQTGELFITGDHLVDGTPCSYEKDVDICIQGECYEVGCDGKLNSFVHEDSCGICGGNNSECSNVTTVFQKLLKREVSRVAVIPQAARYISVEANISFAIPSVREHNSPVTLILRSRHRKFFNVHVIKIDKDNPLIVEGTRFHFSVSKNTQKIWARGPTLSEMVVSIRALASDVKSGVRVSSRTTYTLPAHHLKEGVTRRYMWLVGGWGSCSQSCGGGRKQRTIACRDTTTNRIVARRHCSLTDKPALVTEPCNTFSCSFHWLAGPWEPCTATCGSNGLQHRELYCVHHAVSIDSMKLSNDSFKDAIVKHMLSPSKCSPESRPETIRTCYRMPCIHYWVSGEWSQCSASCGPGFSFRSSYCPVSDGDLDNVCEEPAPKERKLCHGKYNRRNNARCRALANKKCLKDESKYCSLNVLGKYCKLRDFRKMCCKYCSMNKLSM